jgi:phytoene synthase
MAVDHYENFPVASLLLPPALRRPVALIYRFAREADDFADEGDLPAAERLARLAGFGEALRRIEAGAAPGIPWFAELGAMVREHSLPLAPFHDLLSAFSQDVVKPRYADYAELLDYCRRSANPIGRLLLHLFGRAEPEALALSDRICSSLQLINFWQDVALDWRKGRVYLPQDDMARHGVTEAHIAAQRCDRDWRALMAFQVQRTRELMLAGAPLAHRLAGRVALEIRVTVQGGLRILEKLEAAGYDVFHRRPVLKAYDWPLLMLRAAVAR